MMMGKMNARFRPLLAGAALTMLAFAGSPAFAVTPADTLVQAWAIDDTITLDPAEILRAEPRRIPRQRL